MRTTITTVDQNGNRGGYVTTHSAPINPVDYLRNHPSIYEVCLEGEPDEDGNRPGICLSRDQVKPEYL